MKAGESIRKDISISRRGEISSGDYGRNSNVRLQYPKVELGIWGGADWPTGVAKSFEVHLRPDQLGTFRIFARFTAQDAFDSQVIRGDPDPSLLSACMVPPCSFTSSCTNASPIPEPSWDLDLVPCIL